ncbi:hypothetical protein [Actinacidiphila sp. bgisy160]|uniref:hypothetical protein n=1 Tax=Actinacidiphila sp. bgisy160 TaxID=3413796 RepID=UPI003D72125D
MDLTKVEAAVNDGAGYAVLNVRDLREAVGAQRTGRHVAEAISEGLHQAGYRHFPVEIPKDQLRGVLVYRPDSPGAQVLLLVEVATTSPPGAADGAVHLLADLLRKP